MMPAYPQRQQRYIKLAGYDKRGRKTGKEISVFYSLLEGFKDEDLHRKYTHTHTHTHTHTTTTILDLSP